MMFHNVLRTSACLCKCIPQFDGILIFRGFLTSSPRYLNGKKRREFLLNLRRDLKARQSVAEVADELAEPPEPSGKRNSRVKKLEKQATMVSMTANMENPAHEARIKKLLEFFPRKDIETMASSCPQIFTQDIDEITNIIQYISAKMGLDQGDMTQAGVFDYPLEHIVKRHLFLERAGIFQNVDPKKRAAYQMLNPPLRKILRVSDNQFPGLAGLTTEEYQVFCDIFAAQKHKLLDYIAEGKIPVFIEDELEDEILKYADDDDEETETDSKDDPKTDQQKRKEKSASRQR